MDEAKQYEPLQHETVLAHVKIVANEQVCSMFKGKESLAVFLADKLIGTVCRPAGHERWRVQFAGCQQGRPTCFKSMMDAIHYLVDELIEGVITAYFKSLAENAVQGQKSASKSAPEK